jgi:hypothetical protein
MENKYYDIGYLIEIGEEVRGKFGDIEGTIRPVNIVNIWDNKELNNSESTN